MTTVTLDPKSLKDLAQYFADALANYNFSGGGTKSSFLNNSARKSRKTGEPDINTMLSDLNDTLVDSFGDTMKRWKDAHRDATRMLKGSALRDVHDFYVESLTDMAKKTKGASKRLLESYTAFIENNKGNHTLQQEAIKKLSEYNKRVDELKRTIADGSGTEEQLTAIRKARNQVNKMVGELAELGIEVQKIQLETNKKTKKQQIKHAESIDGIIEANNLIIEEATSYVGRLKRLHDEELNARAKFVGDLIKATATGVVEAVDKTVRLVDSRLRNVQAETEFIEAIASGMSPQQLHEWNNANRRTKALLGDSGESFYEGTKDMLNEFGYFGAELREMQTKLADTLMGAGVKPTEQAAEALMETVAKIQMIENVSRDEALQIAREALQSPYYMMHALGKTDEQQIALMRSQLIESRKASRMLGLSNQYLQDQQQEQVNARYGDIISKITKRANLDAFIGTLESELGRQLTDREKELLAKKTMGGLTPKETEEFNATIGKTVGEKFAEISKSSSEALGQANADYGAAAGGIALELLGERSGLNRIGMAQAYTEAGVARETIGGGIANIDESKVLQKSRDSLSDIEEGIRELQTILTGVAANPAGGLMSKIGGFAVDYGIMKGVDYLLGKTRIGKALGLGRGSGGGIAGTWNAAKGMVGRGWNMMRGLGTRGATAMSGMGLGAKMSSGLAGLRTFGDDALNVIKGISPSRLAKGWGLSSIITGTLFGLYEAYNTSTSDYAKELGVEVPTSLLGDLSMRTAGVMADIGENIVEGFTFGAVNGESIVNAMGTDVSDAIGSSINSVLKLFGGGIDDTAYQAMKAQEDMASGVVTVVEEGQEAQSAWDRMISALEEIKNNTEETAEGIGRGNAEYREIEEQKLARSRYAASVRGNVDAMLRQRAEGMQNAASGAISAAFANMDSALGGSP